MKALDINTESWESTAADHSRLPGTLKKQLKMEEEKILNQAEDKRARQKTCISASQKTPAHTMAKSADPGLVSSVATEAVPAVVLPQQPTRAHHWPWPTSTDGGLLAYFRIDHCLTPKKVIISFQ